MDYNYYDVDTYSATLDSLSPAQAAVASGVIIIYAIIGIIIGVLSIIAMWKLFTKAGEKGWKSIIPIYNAVIMFKIVGLSPWLLLLVAAGIIPIIGTIVAGISSFVLTILIAIRLARSYGKSGGFAVGLIFLNTIFMLILGLGNSEYVGPNGEAK